ncbi:hypothetical protein [Trinickia dinghuensis]|uniref:Uncharacterized protein n=1 Tax=Trinickia dinghuensis TaxID=2291023 RepID=A0A3D8K1M6_9BURK|nr:hypothetical protein [Trinickia dinghuensis]RDU99218.1 hypothetical protein DWV00_08825 [Trinickia dinghuensis]
MDATLESSSSPEKLFRTTEEALRFSLNYSLYQQGRALADRLATPAGRKGKGLSGSDGAAQAGMLRRFFDGSTDADYARRLWAWAKTVFTKKEIEQIEAADKNGIIFLEEARRAHAVEQELDQLTTVERAVIVARFALRSLPCHCGRACCAGHRPNPEWEAAIRDVTQAALVSLSGHLSHALVRRKLVEEVFGVKVNLQQLADKASVNKNTVTAHRKIIRVWLSGQKAQPAKGKREAVLAVEGVEAAARLKLDRMLSYLDFIGDE